MPYSNISTALDPAKKTEVLTKLNEIKNALPSLVNLSPEERRKIRKMGDSLTSYVQDVLTVAKANPQTLPATINLGEIEKDLKLIKDLQEIQALLSSLSEGLSDTVTALGSESVVSTDRIYGMLKEAARGNAKLDQSVKTLGQRFKKSKPKPATAAKS